MGVSERVTHIVRGRDGAVKVFVKTGELLYNELTTNCRFIFGVPWKRPYLQNIILDFGDARREVDDGKESNASVTNGGRSAMRDRQQKQTLNLVQSFGASAQQVRFPVAVKESPSLRTQLLCSSRVPTPSADIPSQKSG